MPAFGTTYRIEPGRRGGFGEGFGEKSGFFDAFFSPRWPDAVRLPPRLRVPAAVPVGTRVGPPPAAAVVPTPTPIPSVVSSPKPVPTRVPGVEVGTIPVLVPPPSAVPQGIIDPEENQTATVFESAPKVAPGGEAWRDTPPIDWDNAYERYQELNKPTVAEEADEMAVDWGEILGGVAQAVFPLPTYAAQQFSGMGSPPPVIQPRVVTVDTVTGQIRPCRRRRRRRLLTSSDLADIAALKAIVGGGAALNQAVVKAVRR